MLFLIPGVVFFCFFVLCFCNSFIKKQSLLTTIINLLAPVVGHRITDTQTISSFRALAVTGFQEDDTRVCKVHVSGSSGVLEHPGSRGTD